MRDHKIGKAAQAAGLAALQERTAASSDECAAAETRDRALGRVAAALDALEHGHPLAELLEKSAADRVSRSTIVEKLAAIDAEGDGGLRDRRRAQDGFSRVKKAERKAVHDRNAVHEKAIAVAEYILGSGDAARGSEFSLKLTKSQYLLERRQRPYRPSAVAYRGRLTRLRPMPDTRSIERLDDLASAHGRIASDATAAAEAEKVKSEGQDRALRRALRDYFGDPNFGTSAQVGPESDLLGEVQPWLRLLVADLEGNEIRRHEDRAREAAERIRSLVRGEFLNLLIQRISKMKRDIDGLNRSLRDHPFHN